MKPGYKTTEFWTALVLSLLEFINESGFLGQPLPVGTIMSVAAPAITYIITRSGAKAVAQFLGAKPVDPAKLNQ